MNKKIFQEIWKKIAAKVKHTYGALQSMCGKIAIGVKGSFNRVGKALVHTGEAIVAKIKNLYRSLLILLGLGAIKIKNFYRRSLSMRDTITARVQSAFITLPNMRQSITAKCKYFCETLFNKKLVLNPIAYTLYVIIGCVSFVSVGTYFYLRYTQSPEQRMQEQKIMAQHDDSVYRALVAKNQNLEQQLTTTQATVRSLQQKIETIQEQHKEEKLAAVDSKIDQAVQQQFKNLKKEIAKQRKEDVHKQTVRQFVERLQSDEG